jgi:hypothetical protein
MLKFGKAKGGGMTCLLRRFAYVSLFHVPAQILPGPLLFAAKFMSNMAMGEMDIHIGMTLYEILVGFVIGCVLRLVFGYLLAKSVWLERLFTPYIALAQIATKISIAPLFLLWFVLGGYIQNRTRHPRRLLSDHGQYDYRYPVGGEKYTGFTVRLFGKEAA